MPRADGSTTLGEQAKTSKAKNGAALRSMFGFGALVQEWARDAKAAISRG